MRTLTLSNTDLAVSALCYGCNTIGSTEKGEQADAVLDAYRAAGGNFLDTAHCYAFWLPGGDGASERYLADYFKRRGGREKCIIASKGGQRGNPGYRKVDYHLEPRRVSADLDDSLGRLNCDTIDLYWLHRDDPRADVKQVIDYLNEEVRRGRIRHFAASNWPAARIAQANEYAARQGIKGFVASQPLWSLAWPNKLDPTLGYFEDVDRPWHERSGLPVIPYSPTARGYFAGGGPQTEAFDTPLSDARRQRAADLAGRKGCTATQIALAYLMSHPFAVIPIIGTRKTDHLAEAVAALDVSLSAQEIAWLRDGD